MENNPNLIHTIANEEKDITPRRGIIIFISVIIVGVLTGFIIAKVKTELGNKNIKKGTSQSNAQVKKTAGIRDESKFKDKAEGVLREGGIDGEGNFHLERPGGESQNVYLTSTTVDLAEFIGKKIRVHGETFRGQKAGWLMDVGLVEALE